MIRSDEISKDPFYFYVGNNGFPILWDCIPIGALMYFHHKNFRVNEAEQYDCYGTVETFPTTLETSIVNINESELSLESESETSEEESFISESNDIEHNDV